MKRLKNENYLDFAKRITESLKLGLIGYEEWSNLLIDDNIYSVENTRRNAKFFDKFLQKLDSETDLTKELDVDNLKELKNDLIKERKKIQAQNIELNKTYRDQSRFDILREKVLESIEKLKPIDFSLNVLENKPIKKTGLLCIGDAHYGVEINMKTVFEEPVNIYSPEILKERLSVLISNIVNDWDYFQYEKLVIFDLGDGIQNILRMSDLTKLKIGVVDSVIEYAEIISQFVNKIQNLLNIQIEFYCVGGNHSEIRILQKNRNFEEENFGKIIREFIALRLRDNKNIQVGPYKDCIFKQIEGVNIFGIHGDRSKDEFQEISYWEQYHNITIDILIMGHFHHQENKSVGYSLTGDKEIIKIPSLIGIDDFSKNCRKLARAGAKFILFENKGKSWERTYYLN